MLPLLLQPAYGWFHSFLWLFRLAGCTHAVSRGRIQEETVVFHDASALLFRQGVIFPLVSCLLVWYSKEKGKPQKRPTLWIIKLNVLQHQPSTIPSSWRLFSFVLENLITKTDKGNNEYTKLNQVRICNIHWQPLLSFVWRVSPSEMEGKPPGSVVSHTVTI